MEDDDVTTSSIFDVEQLPSSFKTFLKENDIDPSVYTVSNLPRYVRVNSQAKDKPTLAQLKEQLKTDDIEQMEHMDGFFRIQLKNTSLRISDMKAYKEHTLFGIDVSSAIAVQALEITQDDQVLDLCCAPGAKLCMISNLLGNQGVGTVTGVDLAGHRLATCRSLVKKYKVAAKVRLFEADGTTFDVPPPCRIGNRWIHEQQDKEPDAKRQKTEVRKPFYAPRLLRSDDQVKGRLYDKVLVDAECTHDGSIAHILKYEKWGWDAFEKNFMDKNRLSTITQLQRDLMKQGWSMLRQGGVMVYSTCSLSIRQNEENVAWFLTSHHNAVLEKIPDFGITAAPIKHQTVAQDLQPSIDTFCLRFDPIHSGTSGFFLVRFKKSALNKEQEE